GPFVGFLHQSRREHTLQAPIEGTGTELECVVCLSCDVLHDAVAVPFLVGQGEQDVEDRRGEREQFVRRCRPFHKYIRYGYIRFFRAPLSIGKYVGIVLEVPRCRMMGRMPRTLAVLFALPLLHAADTAPREWPVYGGGPESIRHSTLKQ